MKLSESEKKRYSRHLILPGFGEDNQLRLKAASVVVIGAGGLGSPVLLYLAAAGIGRIGIVDDDIVDESNLQRQVLYRTDEIGMSKVMIAKERLTGLNPTVDVVCYDTRLTVENADEILKEYDVVVAATDNFDSRYLCNDICVKHNKPLIFGSICQYEGQLSVFNYKGGPTYRCLFPDQPITDSAPDSPQKGLIGVLPGIIGCMQANETIKVITETGDTLSGKLYVLNAASMSSYTLNIKKISNT